MRRVFLALLILPLPAVQGAGNGAFSISQYEGKDWFVRPDGERFFSFGVCVVDQGASRGDVNPTNPCYAAFRHYADSNLWAAATLRRLRDWKFTTIGGWSDFGALKAVPEPSVAFTPVLHVGSTCGVPWWDMWDTNIVARMHQVARDQILPLREDPRLLGYYTDNEMGWWSGTLFRMTLEHATASRQRQCLIKLLRETYHEQWPALLKDFEAEGVGSFDDLEKGGMLFLRPGSSGIRTYRRFLGLMAERYYSLVREIVQAYDSRGLILGDRYQSFFYPEVVRACGHHVDAVSANLNAPWNDGTFPRFYLETLHALTGRPILVSEFYMAAQENRSGNRNDNGIFPTVANQKERAVGLRATVGALLQIPYVIGADWFQYYDEPTFGRGDGENFNFGLVDIHNQPYRPLTTAASGLDLFALKSRTFPKRADASQGIPPAPRKPLDHFQPMTALKHWNREAGFVKASCDFPVADFYLCWNAKAIYAGLCAQDFAETTFYREKSVPEVDRAEWNIFLGPTRQPIRARIGAKRKPVVDNGAVRIQSVSGINLDTRNVAAMELPASLFGKTEFKKGDTIELDSVLLTHARADRVEWKGQFTLREPR